MSKMIPSLKIMKKLAHCEECHRTVLISKPTRAIQGPKSEPKLKEERSPRILAALRAVEA